MTDAAASVWVFDDFRPGEALGHHAIALDAARFASWRAIYGASAEQEHAPSGMLVAAMMEAYLMAIRPRPPGNIHASQTLSFGEPAQAGAHLDADVSCLWKEVRKGRCWVAFQVVLRDRGRDVLTGEIRTIWSR